MSSILSKILIGILGIILPFALIFAVDGNYYSSVTSQETISTLIDSVVQEQFQNEVAQYQTECIQYLGRNCTNLQETTEMVCNISSTIERNLTTQAINACNMLNMTCVDLDDAINKICGFGLKDACNALTDAKSKINQAKNVCMQLKQVGESISAQKKAIYNQKILSGFSLSDIHNVSSKLWKFSIVALLVIIGLIYLVSKSVPTTLKMLSSSSIFTGVVFIIPYFLKETIQGFVLQSVPANAPGINTALDFINEILRHEMNVGIVLLVFGVIGWLIVTVISKKYSKGKKRVTRK